MDGSRDAGHRGEGPSHRITGGVETAIVEHLCLHPTDVRSRAPPLGPPALDFGFDPAGLRATQVLVRLLRARVDRHGLDQIVVALVEVADGECQRPARGGDRGADLPAHAALGPEVRVRNGHGSGEELLIDVRGLEGAPGGEAQREAVRHDLDHEARPGQQLGGEALKLVQPSARECRQPRAEPPLQLGEHGGVRPAEIAVGRTKIPPLVGHLRFALPLGAIRERESLSGGPERHLMTRDVFDAGAQQRAPETEVVVEDEEWIRRSVQRAVHRIFVDKLVPEQARREAMMPGGRGGEIRAQRSQPPVVAVALVGIERHARDPRIPHGEVRLDGHVARRRAHDPSLGRSRIEPQRPGTTEQIIGEGVDAPVIREPEAARVAQALVPAGDEELGPGLPAALARAAAFGEELEARRAGLPLPRDELHRAGHGGRPPQRAQRAAGELDPLDIREQQAVDVVEAAADVDRHPVEHHLREGFVPAAHVQGRRAAGPGAFIDRDPGQDGERPGRVRRGLGGEIPAVQHRGRESQLR